jgi:hypothetical protein
MYLYLKQHPQVFLSLLKEPLFFCSDLSRQPLAVADEDEYLSLFNGSDGARAIGEGSVWYLLSAAAPAAIEHFSPGAKILVFLRDPVDMMHSLHALYLRTGNEDLTDFAAAIDAEDDRAAGRRLPPGVYFPEGLLYRRVASYAVQVERYLRLFGRQRIHVTLFDDLKADPAAAYREILLFLGVDPGFQPELAAGPANVRVRGQVLQQLRAASPAVRSKVKTGKLSHAGPKPGPVPPELRARLNRQLRPDVQAVSTLLARDLSAWCAEGSVA